MFHDRIVQYNIVYVCPSPENESKNETYFEKYYSNGHTKYILTENEPKYFRNIISLPRWSKSCRQMRKKKSHHTVLETCSEMLKLTNAKNNVTIRKFTRKPYVHVSTASIILY